MSVVLPEDPGVRIGNVAALKGLGDDSPDVAISLCRVGPKDLPPAALCYQPMLMDQPGVEDNPNLDFMLRDLATEMVAWRRAGKTVFLHCVMAESRTPAVAAAYLAERLGIPGSVALQMVRAVLPNARPNSGFVDAVEELWPVGTS